MEYMRFVRFFVIYQSMRMMKNTAMNGKLVLMFKMLTENGYVSRGICETDADGYLTGITERTHIERRADGAAFTEDDGANWTKLAGDSIASMNLFGFSASMLKELSLFFRSFWRRGWKRIH